MSRRWFIVLGAGILAVVLGFIVWTQLGNLTVSRPQFAEQDIALARKGTLIATVSATGSIEPQRTVSLAFLENGRVDALLVERGELVSAGQPLARLDATALELQLAQAEANLAAAEANSATLRKGPSDSARAAAQANLDSAQAAYDALTHPAPSAVSAAQANYTSALAQHQALLNPNPTELAIAKADVEKARAALAQAQAAYDRIGGASNPFSAQSPQALQLQTATLDYDKALNAFNAKFNPTAVQLQAALAQVEQAKDALARLEPTQENLARAAAQIMQAQDALARLEPTAEELAQADANVDAARAARDLASKRLEDATLVAPVSGTITLLEIEEGAFAQAGRPAVTLADLEHLEITLSIDETDIPRVKAGQPVTLDLDAFPGEQAEGVVREIAPAAATIQGVVNYPVRIEIKPTALAIKPGMTANANVQVARQEDVLLVPTRAIRAQGSRRLVTILAEGEPRDVVVTLGLSNELETEIRSGLAEGAQVLTIALPSNQPSFGGGNR
jgi:HlyD family secretion protein